MRGAWIRKWSVGRSRGVIERFGAGMDRNDEYEMSGGGKRKENGVKDFEGWVKEMIGVLDVR